MYKKMPSIFNSRLRLIVCGTTVCIIALICMVLSMELGYLRKSEIVVWTHKKIDKITNSKSKSKSNNSKDKKPTTSSTLPDDIFPMLNRESFPPINPLHITNGNFSAYLPNERDVPAKVPTYKTPLFIGFTRNWNLLQQSVASYIAVGWPSQDIYIVDNSGVMDSNELGLLSKENPFYLNVTRLTAPQVSGGFGVNVIRTPTLLTFSQLQNFFINYASDKKWESYFWSHMDVVVLGDEDGAIRKDKLKEEYEKKEKERVKKLKAEGKDPELWFGAINEDIDDGDIGGDYRGFYELAVDCMQRINDEKKTAIGFYSNDSLTYVKVKPMKEVGGWDTQIPYETSDCDFYERMRMKGYKSKDCRAGHFFDVADYIHDLSRFFPPRTNETDKIKEIHSKRFKDLKKDLEKLENEKKNMDKKNTWLTIQSGDGGGGGSSSSKGEPFWRNPAGFEYAFQKWISFGQEVYKEKWGTKECKLRDKGRKNAEKDAWMYKSEDKKKLRDWI